MRTLVIGDIHGAYKCLVEVLEKAGPADRVIFLGDYVDGLPETPEVIDHIIGMPNAVCVRGNHDQWAMDWLQKCRDLRNFSWAPERIHYSQGGKSTYDSYMRLGAGDKELKMSAHNEFLSNTLPHFLDEENRLFVHGGVTIFGVGDPWMVKMWDRSLIETAHRMSKSEVKFLHPPFSDFKEIYVGHTAAKFFTDKEEPANWVNLWAMDTNCGWGGPLCAMDIDTKEMFCSRPAREHYPEYQGR